MGRSIKKGPYVQPVLLKRVKEMNEAGEKRVLKTWSRSPISSDILLRFMTVASMFRFM